jgi:hypothetical protein
MQWVSGCGNCWTNGLGLRSHCTRGSKSDGGRNSGEQFEERSTKYFEDHSH